MFASSSADGSGPSTRSSQRAFSNTLTINLFWLSSLSRSRTTRFSTAFSSACAQLRVYILTSVRRAIYDMASRSKKDDFIEKTLKFANDTRNYNLDDKQMREAAEKIWDHLSDSINPTGTLPPAKSTVSSPKRKRTKTTATTKYASKELQEFRMSLVQRSLLARSLRNKKVGVTIAAPSVEGLQKVSPLTHSTQKDPGFAFCEHVLEELQKPKYNKSATPFRIPVDPVALNIPTYVDIIKHPMDLTTISHKLKEGQYSTVKAFKDDFDLMFANCFKFNPSFHPSYEIGQEFQKAFEREWSQKDVWVKKHAV